MTKANLEKTRGDDKVFKLTFSDQNGAAIDLTGYKAWITLKNSPNDLDSAAVYQAEFTNIPNPTLGILYIPISKTAVGVGTFYYDVQLEDDALNVTTILIGKFNVIQDITLTYTP